MDIPVRVRDKLLELNNLRSVLKQGENLADSPVFLLPLAREGVALAGLSWQLTAATDKDTFVTAENLPAVVQNGFLQITWAVGGPFTAVATDDMELMLIGSDAGGVVVRFDGDGPITVAPSKTGSYTPPPDAFMAAIAAMGQMLAQAEAAAAGAKNSAAQAAEIVAAGLAQINTILTQGMIITDPTTGGRAPVQTVVDNIFNFYAQGITAANFDALNITAAEFDAMEITAIEFDSKASLIFGG